MDIIVGGYKLNGNFKSRKQARETFLSHYPRVTEQRLDTELDKLFKDADKSGDLTKEVRESETERADVRQGSTGRKQSGKD